MPLCFIFTSMQPPLSTTHLFPVLDEKLLQLLHSLTAAEWDAHTIARKWTVKDIAAHLLDGNVRTLSFSRDKHRLPPPAADNYRELVGYLNNLNAEWVQAHKRTSPQLLTELLEITGRQFCEYLTTLDPFAKAIFPVAWAGEDVSYNWFHIAREYTEKFIHQQQIRDAVNKPGLMTRELFYPFIDTLMCALPHTYRNINAADGINARITVTSEIGGDWYLCRREGKWQLAKEAQTSVAAQLLIDPDTAWKLFSKGMSPREAMEKTALTGQTELAEPALHMIAVMA